MDKMDDVNDSVEKINDVMEKVTQSDPDFQTEPVNNTSGHDSQLPMAEGMCDDSTDNVTNCESNEPSIESEGQSSTVVVQTVNDVIEKVSDIDISSDTQSDAVFQTEPVNNTSGHDSQLPMAEGTCDDSTDNVTNCESNEPNIESVEQSSTAKTGKMYSDEEDTHGKVCVMNSNDPERGVAQVESKRQSLVNYDVSDNEVHDSDSPAHVGTNDKQTVTGKPTERNYSGDMEAKTGTKMEKDTKNDGVQEMLSQNIGSEVTNDDMASPMRKTEDMHAYRKKEEDFLDGLYTKKSGGSTKKSKKKDKKAKKKSDKSAIINQMFGSVSRDSTIPTYKEQTQDIGNYANSTSACPKRREEIYQVPKKQRQDNDAEGHTHNVSSLTIPDSRHSACLLSSAEDRSKDGYIHNKSYPNQHMENTRGETGRDDIQTSKKPREPIYANDRQQYVSSGQWKFSPPDDYVGVAGEDNILSNFYPCELYVYGMEFWSTEQAYQWRKAKIMSNDDAAKQIYAAERAGAAKRLANQHFRGCNLDKWTAVRIPVMRQLLRAKARSCAKFTNKIRSSGTRVIAEIVKGDQVWGIGDGTGQNVLGRLLMELRLNLDAALQADPDTDGILHDFPPEDIYMLPFPLLPPNKPHHRTLLITTSELQYLDCQDLLPNTEIKKIILKSYEEAYTCDVMAGQFDTITLHLLSRNNMIDAPNKIIDDVKEFVRKIKADAKDTMLCVSLPVSCRDDEEGYDNKADRVSDMLSRILYRDNNQICCQTNKLNLMYRDCFVEDGLLSDDARLMLKYNLMRLMYYHISTPTSFFREQRGGKRQRSGDRDNQSWRRQNSGPQTYATDSSFNESRQASAAKQWNHQDKLSKPQSHNRTSHGPSMYNDQGAGSERSTNRRNHSPRSSNRQRFQ